MENTRIDEDSSTEQVEMNDAHTKLNPTKSGDGSARAEGLDVVDLGDATDEKTSPPTGDTAFHPSGRS